MRRIGSALAAGVATAGLFGAFALLNVASRPPVEQPTLESFAIDAPSPDTAASDAPPAAADPPPARMAVAAPVAEPPPVMSVAPVVPVRRMAASTPAPAPAPPSSVSVRQGAEGAGVAAAPASAAVAGPIRSTAVPNGGGAGSYAARVRAWLLAHKRYPRRSRMHGEEGVVQLRFVLDRAGHLLDGALVAGSDHAALDAEALAMLRRAVPYPAPPGEMRGDRIEIAAAIVFELPRR